MFTDWRRVSFRSEQKQSTSLHERWCLSELRVICTIAGEYRQLTHQPRGLTPIHEKQSGKVNTVALKGSCFLGSNVTMSGN